MLIPSNATPEQQAAISAQYAELMRSIMGGSFMPARNSPQQGGSYPAPPPPAPPQSFVRGYGATGWNPMPWTQPPSWNSPFAPPQPLYYYPQQGGNRAWPPQSPFAKPTPAMPDSWATAPATMTMPQQAPATMTAPQQTPATMTAPQQTPAAPTSIAARLAALGGR